MLLGYNLKNKSFQGKCCSASWRGAYSGANQPPPPSSGTLSEIGHLETACRNEAIFVFVIRLNLSPTIKKDKVVGLKLIFGKVIEGKMEKVEEEDIPQKKLVRAVVRNAVVTQTFESTHNVPERLVRSFCFARSMTLFAEDDVSENFVGGVTALTTDNAMLFQEQIAPIVSILQCEEESSTVNKAGPLAMQAQKSKTGKIGLLAISAAKANQPNSVCSAVIAGLKTFCNMLTVIPSNEVEQETIVLSSDADSPSSSSSVSSSRSNGDFSFVGGVSSASPSPKPTLDSESSQLPNGLDESHGDNINNIDSDEANLSKFDSDDADLSSDDNFDGIDDIDDDDTC